MKTNIKINYMLLEQILRVTGTYKNICDEYKNLHGIYAVEVKDAEKDRDAEKDKDNDKKYFIREYDILDELFKRAKAGDINSLFENDTARDIVLEFIINFTGVPLKYWLGEERIKLDIVRDIGENEDLIYDNDTIDTIDLSEDEKYISIEELEIEKEEVDGESKTTEIIKIRGDGNAYHGRLYQELLKNPLHLDYDEIFDKVTAGKKSSEAEVEKAIKTIEGLYSLRGLLTVLLLNMTDEIELIDKANVYKAKKWQPYVNELDEPTEHGIIYSPKFIEIREGLVQTIIRNIFDLGYVFAFRDELKKEFKIIISKQK